MSNNFKFVSNHRPRTAAANNFNKTTLRGVAGTSTAATYRQPHTWGGLGPVAVNVPVNRIIYNKPGRVEGGRGSLYTASPVYTYPQGRRHLSDGVTCGHTLFLPSVLRCFSFPFLSLLSRRRAAPRPPGLRASVRTRGRGGQSFLLRFRVRAE